MIARLNAEVGAALRAPDLRERLANIGIDAAPSTPTRLELLIHKETELWAKVIAAAGIKPE